MTRVHPFLRRLVVVGTTACLIGLGAGCGNSQTEIPLAKVPPPPAGFGEMKKTANTPQGGSPQNTSDLTK